MKRAGIILSWVVRIFFLLIAIWQILGLLPVLIWLPYLNLIPAATWMAVVIKLLIMFVCFGTFWGLGKLIKHLNGTSQETTVSAAAILRRKLIPKELGPIDPRAIEVLATRERWYQKLIFGTTWRLAASAILVALLIVGAVVYDAVGKSQDDLARYLRWTPERQTHCAKVLAEARAETTTFEARHSLDILEAICTPPSPPKGVLHYLATNLNETFLAWIVLSASLFAILTAVSLYFSERETGWKRLSIVVAFLLVVITGLVFLNSRLELAAAFLLAAASFPTGVLLVLGGRSVVKWVRAGFTNAAKRHSKRLPD